MIITPEKIAVYTGWDGEAVFDLMVSALTDCNYHSEAIRLTQAWEKKDILLQACRDALDYLDDPTADTIEKHKVMLQLANAIDGY